MQEGQIVHALCMELPRLSIRLAADGFAGSPESINNRWVNVLMLALESGEVPQPASSGDPSQMPSPWQSLSQEYHAAFPKVSMAGHPRRHVAHTSS